MSFSLEDVVKKQTITHWKNSKVYTLEPYFPQGLRFWRLLVDGQQITYAATPMRLSEDLADGELDKEIGFSTKGLQIPRDFNDWNRLK